MKQEGIQHREETILKEQRKKVRELYKFLRKQYVHLGEGQERRQVNLAGTRLWKSEISILKDLSAIVPSKLRESIEKSYI